MDENFCFDYWIEKLYRRISARPSVLLNILNPTLSCDLNISTQIANHNTACKNPNFPWNCRTTCTLFSSATMFSFLVSLFHRHICLKLMAMCNRWLNWKARRCCIWNVMETLFCDEDSYFNRKFCRFLFPVAWRYIYNQTGINNVSDSVVKLWTSRHVNTAQHNQLKPAVNVLQTTDTPKVEIYIKCGISHSQYMVFSCLSQTPWLPNGRPQIETLGRFPAIFVATEAGYYLGEVGPCPASFVATILIFFPRVVWPSPVIFSGDQNRYLKPNLDVFLNLTKWFLCQT